ncbi:DUF4296 domain-containing protein [Flavobacterium sp.]|uniref:DUF4296 domain-containing protein n=1 Tax=Flavobacterium sp. TaxID=239 RepID=UPI003F695D5E
MKSIVCFFSVMLFISCGDNAVPKPDNLLSQDKMEDILYDLTVLQAADTGMPQILNDNQIEVNNYIYKKYKIDSITFYQNHKYYASNVKNFKRMYTHITERLNEVRTEVDTLLVKKEKVPAAPTKDTPLIK